MVSGSGNIVRSSGGSILNNLRTGQWN
jgi:hypothetical protein